MDLENITFKIITNEGVKCGFCNKILKPIGLDYLYDNIDLHMIKHERCDCIQAIKFWREYDLEQYEKEKQRKYKDIINKVYKDNYIKKIEKM